MGGWGWGGGGGGGVGGFFHYCLLRFIAFDLICYMAMFVQNLFLDPLGHTPHLALPPGVTSKFRMCSSSLHP